MTRTLFKAADVRRVLTWVKASGLSVQAVEITVDGSLRVLTTRPTPAVVISQDEDWVAHAGEETDFGRA